MKDFSMMRVLCETSNADGLSLVAATVHKEPEA
jgi:hypothetical protein